MRRAAIFAALALLAACERTRPHGQAPAGWEPELRVLATTPERCTIYVTAACQACKYEYVTICPDGQSVTMGGRR